ncbi:MAG: 50S ribosomal protein L4 [Planctomycetota bacterium]|nr:50S ribosomal protein L4 [Planctomycetota bacterium]
MATLDVYNLSGDVTGSVEIDTDKLPSINKQLLHDVVVMYQNNLRQGSAKTKTRGEVASSRRKMYRQKGTGNARAGHRTSGVRRGGGHIFAKAPRNFYYRLPAKAVRKATRMAIASKIIDNEIIVVDGLSLESPKTKEITGLLSNLNLGGKSALITTAENDTNVYKSARNIQRVDVSALDNLNALNVLKVDALVMTREAVEALNVKLNS